MELENSEYILGALQTAKRWMGARVQHSRSGVLGTVVSVDALNEGLLIKLDDGREIGAMWYAWNRIEEDDSE